MASDDDRNAGFNEDLIRKYPRSNRKVVVDVDTYGLDAEAEKAHSGPTTHISPYGIEFQATKEYAEGSLLKIHVQLPDYWTRKQRFVEYQRIDTPETFKVLAKVVKVEDVGKRGKKKLIMAQTIIMDDVDAEVLKSYLQDG